MFAVIFEVRPKPEVWDTYLGLARLLRPELDRIDGFVDNERFASREHEGRILSLSTWRDEKALVRWRTHALHHDVQAQGRTRVFVDYHLRVGEITSDTHPPGGQPLRQERFDTTAAGNAQVVTITEAAPGVALPALDADDGAGGLTDWDRYDGITTPGKGLWLASWRDEAALATRRAGLAGPDRAVRLRAVRIIRDYGMHDRREAPQYFPQVDPANQGEAR